MSSYMPLCKQCKGSHQKNGIFLGIFPKKVRGEVHLFLNRIVDFGGPKSDIFIPKCTEGGSTGLGNIPKKNTIFLVLPSI